MDAPHVYIVRFDEREVECYGTLEETSNFSVVCEDEMDDDVWCDGIEGYLNWEQVVENLQPHFRSPIIEISAV